jgi:cytochrome c oxidase assembly protein subunit 15
MVVVGGITRLTRSGLSMTEWKFTGERPPLTQEDWLAEFDKYKRSPEFKKVNLSMTVEEFKFIYWMEYAHRMWGRVLGLAFGIPFLAFLSTKQLSPKLTKRLALLLCMGGAQGFVGWWMVKSGLEEPENKFEVPRVSPYRLAAHLTSAFVIYATLLWTTLQVSLPQTAMQKAQELNLREVCRASAKLRRLLIPLGCLVSVTAISGAFVAGLDAGHAYNTFPLMGGQVVPEEYSRLWEETGSLLRNTFENTASVQFHHRVLALTTLTSSTLLYLAFRGRKLPQHCNTLLTAMCLTSWCQVSLGITTLLYYVPVELGSAHQAGALTLMSITLATIYCTKPHLASRTQLARRMMKN